MTQTISLKLHRLYFRDKKSKKEVTLDKIKFYNKGTVVKTSFEELIENYLGKIPKYDPKNPDKEFKKVGDDKGILLYSSEKDAKKTGYKRISGILICANKGETRRIRDGKTSKIKTHQTRNDFFEKPHYFSFIIPKSDKTSIYIISQNVGIYGMVSSFIDPFVKALITICPEYRVCCETIKIGEYAFKDSINAMKISYVEATVMNEFTGEDGDKKTYQTMTRILSYPPRGSIKDKFNLPFINFLSGKTSKNPVVVTIKNMIGVEQVKLVKPKIHVEINGKNRVIDASDLDNSFTSFDVTDAVELQKTVDFFDGAPTYDSIDQEAHDLYMDLKSIKKLAE